MATRTRTKTSERRAPSRFSRFAGLERGARDTYAELKKISWPDRQTTRNLTLVVIAISTALGLVLGGIDAVFIRLWEWIPNL
ncbi:MAG: preprotein translocase subunit SecE [Thermomicrobiaceae bacterium]|nr:preprotein translocase subunit SecE [Thermomicrobiaceae bacterium]